MNALVMVVALLGQVTETEQRMVDNVNQYRARSGLHALVIDPILQESTRQHACWMATNRKMSHAGPYGENIAMGQTTCLSVHNTWANSSGHRANMLGGWTKIGASVFRSSSGRLYWCLRFSR